MEIDLWECWIADPKIFEYALRHYPEIVDREIADDPERFEQFKAMHPHVHYSEELQAKRVAAWEAIPCGSVASMKGKKFWGNVVYFPPKKEASEDDAESAPDDGLEDVRAALLKGQA